MNVTKQLGFQYIWIDALCIVQDSKKDFLSEVGNIAEIYLNTAVNIIAAACRNPLESLFRERDCRNHHIGRLWPSWNTADTSFAPLQFVDSLVDCESFRADFENATTTCRGWILQERILPSKRIYFFRTQLYFTCRSSEACEVFPDMIPSLVKSLTNIYDLPSPHSLFSNWNFLAEEYNNCAFTNPSDKLFALWGLLKVFKDATSDEYIAGIWKSKLPLTLGWHGRWKNGSQRRSKLNLAPTWSWLSIDGEITVGNTNIICTHHTVICEVLAASIISTYAFATETEVLTLETVSFNVCVGGDGTLTIPRLSKDRAEKVEFYPDDTGEKLSTDFKLIMAILTIECVCENFPEQKRHSMEGTTRWTLTALILQQDGRGDFYRRVGCLQIMTAEPRERLGKPHIAEDFGLTIENSFGNVTARDHGNWATLHII